jgi:hypothetical protein
MVSQPVKIFFQFAKYIISEFWIVEAISSTGEYEILPYQDAVPITQAIEGIIFVISTSPDPEHIHVD